jgi:hypothetical protein
VAENILLDALGVLWNQPPLQVFSLRTGIRLEFPTSQILPPKITEITEKTADHYFPIVFVLKNCYNYHKVIENCWINEFRSFLVPIHHWYRPYFIGNYRGRLHISTLATLFVVLLLLLLPRIVHQLLLPRIYAEAWGEKWAEVEIKMISKTL